ncbi:tyrosine-type recombinase/integrase [Roseicyclus marinus]|uniref:Tyr recombinase domain-containing protein n=1 Tax=Roseicyclus marinus TaxID=2161673 RepID=A0AA48HLJ7_9RHOB|nr:integrase [Roseicyclus marinus]
MSVDLLPVLRPARIPWNKGRIIGQKRPLLPRHVWSIRVRLEMAGNTRDLALFNMAVDSKLRGCDLVSLRVPDVFAAGRVKERTSMIQSKTGKLVRFEITETTRLSLERWISDPEMIGLDFLWPSRIHGSPHVSTRQYARIVRGWVMSLGLEPSAYGTHSMRRTKVAQIYKKTGNLRAVQLRLGHTRMDSTVRYLGVDIEDALSLSDSIDL